MATPCVAGAVALMLEKNPYLTPALICEILETTAVKLTEKKSNKTGSGRIDILAAMNYLDEIPDECQAPSNLTANALTYNSVELSWEGSKIAKEYEVYRDNEKIATVNTTSYSDLQLENDTQYCYTVKSVCSLGISEPSDEACITTSNNEGINDVTSSFNIYPNPVEDNLIITTDAIVENIIVYDMYGKTQKLRNSETQKLKNTIDVSDLNSGVYFIRITTENGESTKLFIKK
jgi:hypothetical protein